ncbi:MAG: hypothetical protein HY873_12520 [Chloroflexi bacterium]|nr:hypothetical protein [Chloroflexota bacterium]
MSPRPTWILLLPVVAVAAALLAILALDVAKGGSAQPGRPLGEAKNQRFPYQAPTATQIGAQPTPKPRPSVTSGGGRPGNPADRDIKRRTDLLLLLEAAGRFKQQNGSLPTTEDKVQSLCAYETLDQGCAFEDVLSPLPIDPLGAPVENGYWYSSNGQKAKFYSSLEVEIPEDQRCPTEDAELKKRAYLICVETP